MKFDWIIFFSLSYYEFLEKICEYQCFYVNYVGNPIL